MTDPIRLAAYRQLMAQGLAGWQKPPLRPHMMSRRYNDAWLANAMAAGEDLEPIDGPARPSTSSSTNVSAGTIEPSELPSPVNGPPSTPFSSLARYRQYETTEQKNSYFEEHGATLSKRPEPPAAPVTKRPSAYMGRLNLNQMLSSGGWPNEDIHIVP